MTGGTATDPQWFRRVLGQYPSGVCIVTAVTADARRTGMVVGSFTSVSLDPPMVAFFPSNTSQTWPEISGATSFCVNVMAADQEPLCRRFASAPAEQRFDGVGARPAPSGAPVLDGVVAWIDCTPAVVQEAGDHYLVIGNVTDLHIESTKLPLLFFRGGYGSFSPLNFTASDTDGVLARQLRYLDLVRPVLQTLPDHGLRCLVTTRSGDRIVVIGRFEPATVGETPEPTTLVGQELPFRPHGPSIFHAWSEDAEVDAWLGALTHEERAGERESLASIRARGYSVGLVNDGQRRFAQVLDQLASRPGTVPPERLTELIATLHYDPPELTEDMLRSTGLVSAPVFDRGGRVVLAITVFGFSHEPHDVRAVVDRLVECGEEATRLVGGRAPDQASRG